MSDKILAALAKLDPKNDNHWTIDGLPRLDTLKFFASGEAVGREQLEVIAPGFTRAVAAAGTDPATLAAPTAEGKPVVAPVAPSAPPLPAVQVPKPAPTKEELIAAEKHKLHKAEQELEELLPKLHELTALKNKLDGICDEARIKLSSMEPPASSTDAIQSYLSTQRKLLEDRAEQIHRAREFEKLNGVKLSDIIPKRSKLDESMARRNTRGTARPS